MAKLPVSVIVVSFNSAHCLQQAFQSARDATEWILVDNASTDGSVLAGEKLNCKVVRNHKNKGFGTACNQGAHIATSEFLLFLNPDAQLASSALEAMVDTLAANPGISAVGPHQFKNSEISAPHGDALHDVVIDCARGDFLSGAGLLCRKRDFDDIGGFDEGFFLYFEDEDLSRRFAERGQLVRVASAKLFHQPGTGAKLAARQKFMKYRHYGRSRAYFSRKHGVKFSFAGAALEQAVKGIIALAKFESDRSAQHFGRAVGYIEGRYFGTS